MKKLIVLVLAFGVAHSAFCDIQDPPSNDYGPTRKLGRGVANLFIAPTEIMVTITTVNTYEGNSAAASYGVVRGVGRAFARGGAGLFEMLTFPFPLRHESYAPLLPSDIPWIHAGYAEFPPELGNETKYNYVRDY
jgi:putative exosortase-associated protein (TIGR04073 family)